MSGSRGTNWKIGECIKKKVEKAEFAGIAEGPISMTIGGGTGTLHDNAGSLNEVLARADKALYSVKKDDRNRARSFKQLPHSKT